METTMVSLNNFQEGGRETKEMLRRGIRKRYQLNEMFAMQQCKYFFSRDICATRLRKVRTVYEALAWVNLHVFISLFILDFSNTVS